MLVSISLPYSTYLKPKWWSVAKAVAGMVKVLPAGAACSPDSFCAARRQQERVFNLRSFLKSGGRVVSVPDSGSEEHGFESQSRRCRVAVNLRQPVYTHCAEVNSALHPFGVGK